MSSGIPDLVPIWTAIIALSVFLYVLLDGFDLGIGILYGFAPAVDRPALMNAIAPAWDGNETWLVLVRLALLAVFPLAFAIIVPAVYFPAPCDAVGDGVSRRRLRIPLRAPMADTALGEGLLCRLGGRDLRARRAAGRFHPGLHRSGSQFRRQLLGLADTILRTDRAGAYGGLWPAGRRVAGDQDRGRAASLGTPGREGLSICVLAAILAISIWTPLLHPAIAARWFGWPNLLLLAPVPIVTVVLAAAAWRALGGWGSDAASFLTAMGLFLMSYLGIAISLWPMIVPQHFTLWQAASAPGTQAFLLIGTMGLLPVILMYTAWSYWVFRGKLRGEIG